MRHRSVLGRGLVATFLGLGLLAAPQLAGAAAARSAVPAAQGFCVPGYSVFGFEQLASFDPAILQQDQVAGVAQLGLSIKALSGQAAAALAAEPQSNSGLSALNAKLHVLSTNGSSLATEIAQLAADMKAGTKVPSSLLSAGGADAKAVTAAISQIKHDLTGGASWTAGYAAVCGQWDTAALRAVNLANSASTTGPNWIVTQAALQAAVTANGHMQLLSTTVGKGVAGSAVLLVHPGSSPSGIAIYSQQKSDVQICLSIANKGQTPITVSSC